MNDHERYMRRAIALADNVPDLPFGAVIVDGENDTILAEEVVRRSPAWNCSVIGGVLERDCDALFQKAMRQRASAT